MGIRLNKALTILNISLATAVEFLKTQESLEPTKEMNVNTKISDSQYDALLKRFAKDKSIKESSGLIFPKKKKKNNPTTAKSASGDKKEPINLNSSENPTVVTTDSVVDIDDLPINYNVSVNNMRFGNGYITLSFNGSTYVCTDERISKHLNSGRHLPPLVNAVVRISFDHMSHRFSFSQESFLNELAEMSKTLDEEIALKKAEEKEKIRLHNLEKQQQALLKEKEKRILFSHIRFGNGFAAITIKNVSYKYKNKEIKNIGNILSRYYSSASKRNKNKVRNYAITVVIDEAKQTFKFKDFDLFKFIIQLNERFVPSNNVEKRDKPAIAQPPKTTHRQRLSIDSIEFYDGYFLVYMMSKGVKNNKITPLRVNSTYSFASLRVALQHLANNFPTKIIVEYTDERVSKISPEYNLSKYIRLLNEEYYGHKDWIAEYENTEKPSLATCRNYSQHIARKKISLKCYLDNLANLQNGPKLCLVYEVNHGTPQDAFIFTIDMPDDRVAVVFENAENEASTATEIFITKKKNEEKCINLVFDYFTNYAIENKRDDLRQKRYLPASFMAEKFLRIGHGELETWLVKLNQILNRKTEKSDIEFVPGLHVPQDYESRAGHEAITTKNIHNELMRRLYAKLTADFGTDNVGTEIRVGSKRIDTVVKTSNGYDIYEVKSDPDPAVCITQALGQICEYAYLYCRDRIGKMVVVGSGTINTEVSNQLLWLRKRFSLEIYYESV